MKKIGLLLRATPEAGGTFQYSQAMLNAVAALPAASFSVVVGYTSDLWLKFLHAHDLRTVSVPLGWWETNLAAAWGFLGLPISAWRRFSPYFFPAARTLVHEQCDIWIFPSQDSLGFQVPVPALVSVHDLMHRYERRFPEMSAKGEYRGRERHYRNICRWAQGVLVDSSTGRQHVRESYGLAEERIHLLPYISPDYMYAPEPSEGFDSRYDLPARFIFYPAQFWEHKNHRRLISAVASLKRELPDLKLVLAGSTSKNYAAVVKLVEETQLCEEVLFLGYVPDEDMPEMYRRARALVMPTFFGPTNIPPLEAFVAGCPVAISGIYGMPEQVGDAALLFNPESVEEIADCIRRLWLDDDLCATLVEKGRQRSAQWGQEQFNARLRVIIERTS